MTSQRLAKKKVQIQMRTQTHTAVNTMREIDTRANTNRMKHTTVGTNTEKPMTAITNAGIHTKMQIQIEK